jgi:LDH2 family malate/lactate/ureidoglycolate dehydrogenase
MTDRPTAGTDGTEIDLDERTSGQWWFTDEEMVRAPVASTRRAGEEILRKIGATDDEAAYLFDIFLNKALQGDHGRGLADFPFNVRRIAVDGAPLRPEVRIVRESPATAVVDSDTPPNNWWHNILLHRAAMDIAIDKARATGVGWVGLRSSLLVLTAQMKQAIDAGMLGLAITQTYPLVAPFGGYRPMLGNAPIAFGIPAGEHDPVILDMSLTQTSSTGVHVAAMHGIPVPEGCILDEHGNPTTDASTYARKEHGWHEKQQARGTLTPLGSSHKGYGMVFVVGLLSALMSDTSYPWDATAVSMGMPENGDTRYGSVLAAVDIGCFGSVDVFRSRVDEFIDVVKASGRREGVAEILYPGEKSQRLQRERSTADVFAVPSTHYEKFTALAAEYGVDLSPTRSSGVRE